MTNDRTVTNQTQHRSVLLCPVATFNGPDLKTVQILLVLVLLFVTTQVSDRSMEMDLTALMREKYPLELYVANSYLSIPHKPAASLSLSRSLSFFRSFFLT